MKMGSESYDFLGWDGMLFECGHVYDVKSIFRKQLQPCVLLAITRSKNRETNAIVVQLEGKATFVA